MTDSDVRYTVHAGCPVGRGGLRKIEIGYRCYDGIVRRGELIVAALRVDAYIAVFQRSPGPSSSVGAPGAVPGPIPTTNTLELR